MILFLNWSISPYVLDLSTGHPVHPCWGHRPQVTWLLSEGHHRHKQWSQFTWLEPDSHRQVDLDMGDLVQWSHYNIVIFSPQYSQWTLHPEICFVICEFNLCSALPITTPYALCSRWHLTVWHIDVRKKWQKLCIQYFQKHFPEWELWQYDSNFTETCSKGSN